MPRALATDLYQLTMMAGYHVLGDDEPRSFEMFVRHLPPHRSYLVAAGLEQALSYLETLRFRSEEIEWLRSAPALARVPASFFDELLAEFRFTGEVWAVVRGGSMAGGAVDSLGDHRIAMAAAVAAQCAAGPVRITDCANVDTSFPGFLAAATACGFGLAPA